MIHWGLMFRYSLTVVLPLVLGFWLVERLSGAATLDQGILVLSIALPIIAASWLLYENFRLRKK